MQNQLGILYPGDTTFILSGDADDIRVQREPDIAFVKQENFQPTKGFIYQAPDLAIEIVSPSQSVQEIVEKAQEFLQYGTQEVWVVMPETQQITVYKQSQNSTFSIEDTLISSLFSDFELPVKNIFQQ
jgi:Uma2 family endonuclease